MKTISNFNKDNNIFIDIKDEYIIHIKKFYFFSHENFMFTIEKTFEKYQPIIKQNNNDFLIIIKKDYPIGSILKDFYYSIYKQWLYY